MATAVQPQQPAPAAISSRTSLSEWMATQVSGASLGIFRICFGLIMLLEAISICRPMASAAGSIPLETYYTSAQITYHLPYPAFEWLPLLSPGAMRLVVWIMGLASLSLAAGLLHRISAALVFLTWGYLYAVESTRTYWMSYYYLELLISFLLIWMPAARRYSIRNLFSKTRQSKPAKKNDKNASPAVHTVPYWPILLLRAQLVITYFYAGVAKLNADWLLDAQPVRRFLTDASAGAPQMLQPLFASLPFAYFLSWSGALFDLSVGFLLLARRTRALGMVMLILFHSMNHFLLFDDIVWFPLLGVLSATIFLNPDWPGRFRQWLRKPRIPSPELKWLVPGAILLPVIGAALGWKARPLAHKRLPAALSRAALAFMAIWLAVQVIVPLRHFFIPGDARVTFEGLSFSWRLKSEFYGAEPVQITLNDPNILSFAPDDTATIHWDRWPGDKVFYRVLKSGQVDWTKLPEIVVTFEPRLGERIFYNPVSGGAQNTDAQANARVQAIWRERFGREPKAVARTFPWHKVLEGYSLSLQSRGFKLPDLNTPQGVRDLANGLLNDPGMTALLRRTHPFAIQKGSSSDHPFLLIEDPALLAPSAAGQPQLDRTRWRFGPEQAAPGDTVHHTGAEPLTLYLLEDRSESLDPLPRAALITRASSPSPNAPVIHWNMFKDGTLSKAMHVSTNPFLLRRYARRVAKLWQQTHGSYPQVFARTGLSLNGRPPQETVDPRADLASVPASSFKHNDWIRDLQLPRIPENLGTAIHGP